MSAIEQALREIDAQAAIRPVAPALSVPGPLSSLAGPMPLSRQARHHWIWMLLGMVAILLLGGAWVLGSLFPVTAERAALTATAQAQPTAAAERAETPTNGAPVNRITFVPDSGERIAASEYAGNSAWMAAAAQVWSGGLKHEAARMWSDGLRGEPPTRLAWLLADRLPMDEADALYWKWAGAVPLVVLKHPHEEPSRWMVLAVPVASDVGRVQHTLTQALGPRVQWGSAAEWLARLMQTSPADLKTPDLVQVQAPPAPAAAPARTKPGAPTGSGSLSVSVVTTPLAAPTEAAVAPVSVVNNAPRQGLKSPSAAPPAMAAEVPEILRRTPSASDQKTGVPVAVRFVNVDFESLEKQLASGDYSAAREGVLELEKAVGMNWRTRYLLGVAESGLQSWREAEAALRTAQSLNPMHLRLALYLSVAQQELGEHTAAISTLYLLQEKHRDVPEIWLNQGHSFQAMGQTEDARSAYRRFLSLSTGRPEMQAQRDWVLGQIEEAQ